MMVPLAAVFGLLALGLVLVIYGTIVKNKWGFNLEALSCPRCNAPAPRTRRARTRPRALWGGWTCPGCGAEVDKWGREVSSSSRDVQVPGPSPKAGQLREPTRKTLIDWFKGRSRLFWVITLPLVVLDIWYDYYSPRAIVFDVVAAVVLFIWYRRSRPGYP
jgi:hypothetical protein